MVRVLYSNIRGLHENLDELAVAETDYDVLVCAESKVSIISELHNNSAPYPYLSLPLTEAEERHTWCPRFGSLC